MTDAMRSEFEEWAVSENYNIDIKFDSDSSCLYRSKLTQGAWIIWQACAARMVPKKKVLPELLLAEYHEAKGWNACVDSMLVAAPEGMK